LFTIAILITFAVALLYFSAPNKDREDPYLLICLSIGMLVIFIAFVIKTEDVQIHDKKTIFALLGLGIALFLLAKYLSYKNMKIKARQAKFWDVSPEEILNTTSNLFVVKPKFTTKLKTKVYKEVTHPITQRKKHKFIMEEKIYTVPKRKEVKDLKEPYLYELDEDEKVLGKIIYSDIRRYNNFTVIPSLEYFESEQCSRIHALIFEKIFSFNILSEKNLDFEKALKNNKNILEFFILDMWEKIATKEIIGTSTLYAIAQSDKEIELIGAMDTAISSIIVPEGVALWAHYCNFKDRIL
jgi:hypothetical protein